jgi:hypothetical protein
MMLIKDTRNLVIRQSLALAAVLVFGCNAEQGAPDVAPKVAPTTRSLEDIKNDVKPPVVVGPSAAPATSAPAPKKE